MTMAASVLAAFDLYTLLSMGLVIPKLLLVVNFSNNIIASQSPIWVRRQRSAPFVLVLWVFDLQALILDKMHGVIDGRCHSPTVFGCKQGKKPARVYPLVVVPLFCRTDS